MRRDARQFGGFAADRMSELGKRPMSGCDNAGDCRRKLLSDRLFVTESSAVGRD